MKTAQPHLDFRLLDPIRLRVEVLAQVIDVSGAEFVFRTLRSGSGSQATISRSWLTG